MPQAEEMNCEILNLKYGIIYVFYQVHGGFLSQTSAFHSMQWSAVYDITMTALVWGISTPTLKCCLKFKSILTVW